MQRGPSCNGTPIENTFIMSVRNTKRYILEMFMMYVNFLKVYKNVYIYDL
jgi:hypothetical protein